MADNELLASPTAAPDLQIPNSSSTVDVRIIDTTSYGKVSASIVFTPKIHGLDTFEFPSFSFLVSSKAQNKHVLFDLGQDKNWETSLPSNTVQWIKSYMPFQVKENVEDILDADTGKLGITSKDIAAVVWSHHHFDHRGDVTKFPATTELVVGPGFLSAYTPAYPTNQASSINGSELQGRTVRELSSQDLGLTIGDLPANDFFGDGSFYLLSTPGHTTGHLCGLARVTCEPKSTFVFMGGDCAHYPAIFRPSEYLPLPKEIPAVPGSRYGTSPCPGQLMVDYAHPSKNPSEPFLKSNSGVNEDQAHAEKSIGSMQKFDCNEDVLVVVAHDKSVLGNLDFYPNTLNDWQKQGRKGSVRWLFCGDIDVKSAKHAAE